MRSGCHGKLPGTTPLPEHDRDAPRGVAGEGGLAQPWGGCLLGSRPPRGWRSLQRHRVLELGPVQRLQNALCNSTVLSSSVPQSLHPLLQNRQRRQAFLGKTPRRHANQQQVIQLGGGAEVGGRQACLFGLSGFAVQNAR